MENYRRMPNEVDRDRSSLSGMCPVCTGPYPPPLVFSVKPLIQRMLPKICARAAIKTKELQAARETKSPFGRAKTAQLARISDP